MRSPKEIAMRHLFAVLSLSVAIAGTATAQGEIIIRRPGVPDRVIQLDSARIQEQVMKVQGQLREMASTMQLHNRELEAKVQGDLEPLRARTLALREDAMDRENMVAPMMKRLGAMRRQPHLGVQVNIEPRESDKYGALITAVTPGSAAEKAGILSHDIIVRIAGKSLTEKSAKDDDSNPGLRLISIIATLTVGKPVDVELRRGTQSVNVKVTPTDDASSTIAWSTEMPSITEFKRQGQPLAGEYSLRAMPTMPPSSLFSNGNMAFTINGMFSDNLFANLELTALNEKLGSYFGTADGVLVVSTEAHRNGFAMAAPAIAGAPRDIVLRQRLDSAMRSGARAGTMVRRDTAVAAYIDGVPVQPSARRAPFTMGLEAGDVILSVDGRKVTSPSQLMRIVGTYDHNDEFKLQIMRQKHAETLSVKMP
jgi:type II secretory pathway component PulC